MRNVVVTDPPKPAADAVGELASFGVATVHEALGRVGFLGPRLRPVQTGARISGCAVTVLCSPGDNLMIHVAIEQCGPGDVLVVAVTSTSTDGMFGELFATALAARGVHGAVIDAGARDTADLRAMGFPVWSAAVSAQGTVKATLGAVNVPVTVGGQVICPGDAIIADDDGVLCVPRASVPGAVSAARVRVAKEQATREAFLRGEVGLDRYGLRAKLTSLVYLTTEQYQAGDDHRAGAQ